MNRVDRWLLAAILLVFGPNWIYMTDAAIGAGSSDALKHVWSQWIVHQNLNAGHPLSMSTGLIHYPSGGAFFSLDTFNAWLAWPISTVFGAVTAYNAIVVANIGAAAWAAKTLAQELSMDEPSQWLVGFSFAVSAWMLSFPLASGVSETAVIWPLPLIIIAAKKTWSEIGWKWPAIGGVLLITQGIACWSHGITAGLILGGLGVANWRGLVADRQRMTRIALLLGTAIVIAAPWYAAITGTVSADDAIKTRTLSLFHSSPLNPLDVPEANSMALVDFFLPGQWGRRVSQAGTEQLMYAAYPGWGLLILGGLALRRKTPNTRIVLFGALAFAMLSMGPRVYLDHARTVGGLPNPVYLVAYWLVPLVNATIHSVDRFAVGVQLCVAILAAMGLAHCTPRIRWACIGWVLIEALLVSPGKWPIPMVKASIHPASIAIQQSTHSGAVIDIPYMTSDNWFNGDIFLQQTAHGRPIPFQLEGHGIETAHPTIAANPYFQALSANRAPERPCDGLDELATLGVGWVVLREGASAAVQDSLERCLGAPETMERRRLFRIVPSP